MKDYQNRKILKINYPMMYNIKELGFESISDLIMSDGFKSYLYNKLINKKVENGIPIFKDILSDALKIGEINVIKGESHLKSNIIDYLNDLTRYRKLKKINNKIKHEK